MLPEASVTAKVLFTTGSFALSSTLVYLGINAEAFMLFSLLLGMDYSTGILKARAIKESITSNKMKYGIISKFSLILIPIVLAIGAKAVGADFGSVLLAGINMLILSEVYSIIGNIYAIKTHEELPEYDVVAMIGKRIRNALLKTSEGN